MRTFFASNGTKHVMSFIDRSLGSEIQLDGLLWLWRWNIRELQLDRTPLFQTLSLLASNCIVTLVFFSKFQFQGKNHLTEIPLYQAFWLKFHFTRLLPKRSTCLFPTCQVRDVRFYVGGAAPPPPSFFLLPPSSSFFLAGPHLPALDRSEPRQISSASSWSQWASPDLNRRDSDRGGPRRTSTGEIRSTVRTSTGRNKAI